MGILLVSEIVMPTGEIVLVDDDFDHSGAISMSGNGYPQMTNPETGKSVDFKKEYDGRGLRPGR